MLNIIRIGTFLTRYLFWQELAYQKNLFRWTSLTNVRSSLHF